jgi:hypothetical protein
MNEEECKEGRHVFAMFESKVIHDMGASLRTHQYDIQCLFCKEMVTQRFLNISEIPDEVINDFYTRMSKILDEKYPPLEESE